jgi:hypothetical protein
VDEPSLVGFQLGGRLMESVNGVVRKAGAVLSFVSFIYVLGKLDEIIND